MKNYKMIQVVGKKSKGIWIYQFIFEGKVIGEKITKLKQNRLEQLSFNFCLENQHLGFSTWTY